MPAKFATVDEYVASFPPDVGAVLQTVRRLVQEVAPGADEQIRYQIPAFFVDGTYLVYAGAWKRHLGLYPVPELDAALESEVAPFRASKDTVRLPYEGFREDLVRRLFAALVARRPQGERP